MIYEGVSREEIVDFIPYTIEYLEMMDRSLSNVELIIRDTDYAYWDLRLESKGVLSDDLYNKICAHTKTHCCKCGSVYLVRKVDVGLGLCTSCSSDYMSPFDTHICADCYEKLYRDKVDANELTKFQIKRNAEEPCYSAPHKKVRLLTADGHIVYRFINEISVDGDEYFITPRNQKSLFSSVKSLFQSKREKVTILGVDTGKRDINDERIFTGDVLLVVHKQLGRKWFAEMQGNYSTCSFGLNGSHQKHYWWLYDGDNFPVPFSDVASVEIVGCLCNGSMWDWQEQNMDLKEAILKSKEHI